MRVESVAEIVDHADAAQVEEVHRLRKFPVAPVPVALCLHALSLAVAVDCDFAHDDVLRLEGAQHAGPDERLHVPLLADHSPKPPGADPAGVPVHLELRRDREHARLEEQFAARAEAI